MSVNRLPAHLAKVIDTVFSRWVLERPALEIQCRYHDADVWYITSRNESLPTVVGWYCHRLMIYSYADSDDLAFIPDLLMTTPEVPSASRIGKIHYLSIWELDRHNPDTAEDELLRTVEAAWAAAERITL
jgi:hypothetical protein